MVRRFFYLPLKASLKKIPDGGYTHAKKTEYAENVIYRHAKKGWKGGYYAKQQNLSHSDAHGRRLPTRGNGIWEYGLSGYAPAAAIGAVRITAQSGDIPKCGNRWIPPDFLPGRQRGAGNYGSHLYGFAGHRSHPLDKQTNPQTN